MKEADFIGQLSEDAQTAWGAGLLEGEGCFSIFHRKDRRSTVQCAIHLEMTDLDTVQRVQNVFKCGNMKGPIRRPKDLLTNRKPTWIWSVQTQADIYSVLCRIFPYLSERRQLKAKELIDYLGPKVCSQV